jgi:DNA uptake protein ComE-like DNA-binding protein
MAHLMIQAFMVTFALLVMLAGPATAQTGLIDVNMASEAQLAQQPHMTPAMAKEIVARRPFKTVIELNKFLLDQKLTPAQATDFYRKAFVKINLNTGTKDEFMLIPGVGARMSAEFAEYRPWKSWAQFDKEIGKYVGQQETDRFKQYVFIPGI